MIKIVNLSDLLKQPIGTLYWEYKPEIFYNMAIFMGQCGELDFWNIPLDPEILHNEGHDGDIVLADGITRWGCYDYSQLFAVADSDEVRDFIRVLRSPDDLL